MDESSESHEYEWAVSWSPGAAPTSTGQRPPWSADYDRWKHSRNAVVYRRTVTTRTTVEILESDWAEVPA